MQNRACNCVITPKTRLSSIQHRALLTKAPSRSFNRRISAVKTMAFAPPQEFGWICLVLFSSVVVHHVYMAVKALLRANSNLHALPSALPGLLCNFSPVLPDTACLLGNVHRCQLGKLASGERPSWCHEVPRLLMPRWSFLAIDICQLGARDQPDDSL